MNNEDLLLGGDDDVVVEILDVDNGMFEYFEAPPYETYQDGSMQQETLESIESNLVQLNNLGFIVVWFFFLFVSVLFTRYVWVNIIKKILNRFIRF